MGHSAIVLTAGLCLVALGCRGGDSGSDSDESGLPPGEVRVLAAASLTDVFTDIAAAFEQAVPDIDVTLGFGGSSSLAVSIEEGAPADVFAAADTEVMDRLADAQLLAGTSRPFATNTVTVAVRQGDDTVTSLRDFERDDLFLGACASQVPCGRYADELFEVAGVTPLLDTRAPDVRAVVNLLVQGELDAGIVYDTDVVAHADALRSLPKETDPVVATYPIAVLDEASNPGAAQRFVDFLLGADAQALLADAGFGAP